MTNDVQETFQWDEEALTTSISKKIVKNKCKLLPRKMYLSTEVGKKWILNNKEILKLEHVAMIKEFSHYQRYENIYYPKGSVLNILTEQADRLPKTYDFYCFF